MEAPKEEKVDKPAGLQTRPAWWRVGPPGRLPGGLPRCCRLPGVPFASVQALRQLMTETISFRDPTLMVKYWGPRLTMA